MRIHDEIAIERSPEEVFSFMAEPSNLMRWQTSKTHAIPLDDGPPRRGYRIAEGTKVGPRAWEQIVEFKDFDPGHVLEVEVVEGPRSTGRWLLEPAGTGTRLTFDGSLEAPKLLEPVLGLLVTRQFRGYHRNLKRELEAAQPPPR